jgi:hypothetical protein
MAGRRRSASIEPEHLAALKALRRAGLDPTVIDVRRNTRPNGRTGRPR